MVVLNYTGEEINAKIVYYGPGLSGKTTNLEYLYGQMPADSKGQMVSMKTRTDRTLFFDFFPLELGEINGYRARFLLYTVPGQVYYNATRKLVLKGADAVVFVADSAPDKLQENLESLRNLEDNLNEHGLSLDNIPWVIQYNKRDLDNCMEVAELHQHLNLMNVPAFEGIAMTGFGVYDTFKSVAGMLYRHLKEKLESGEGIPAQSADGQDTAMPPTPNAQGTVVEDAIDSALREIPGAQSGAHAGAEPTPVLEPQPVVTAPLPSGTADSLADAPVSDPPSETPYTQNPPVDGVPESPVPAPPQSPYTQNAPFAGAPDVAPESPVPAPPPQSPYTQNPPLAGAPESPVPAPPPQTPHAENPPVGGAPETPVSGPATNSEPSSEPSSSQTSPSQPPPQEVSEPTADDTADRSFGTTSGEQDMGRILELDETPEEKPVEAESPDFITDPMQRSSSEVAAEIETEDGPVVTERVETDDTQELTVPVVISRSQVRKSVPLTLRLEIRVVDD